MSDPETPADDAPESATPGEPAGSEPAADATAEPDAEAPAAREPEVQEATIRRAPRIGVFLVFGAMLGALVTLVLTSLFPVDPNVGFTALYAYFLLYGIPAGLVLGGLVGLVLDRRSRRRTRTVHVEHERVD